MIVLISSPNPAGQAAYLRWVLFFGPEILKVDMAREFTERSCATVL